MARDTTALTDEVEFFDEPTVEVKKRAQRVVASHSTDAAEARIFLQMLGLDAAQINETPLSETGARFP